MGTPNEHTGPGPTRCAGGVGKYRSPGQPAVLLVTHDVDEAIAVADRVAVLEHGHVVLDQPVPLAKPRDRSDPNFAAIRTQPLNALGVAASTTMNDHDEIHGRPTLHRQTQTAPAAPTPPRPHDQTVYASDRAGPFEAGRQRSDLQFDGTHSPVTADHPDSPRSA